MSRAAESPRSLVVLPARLASTRLPRKMLLAETGKPLIQHAYEGARAARRPVGLCVAVDDEELAAAVRHFGGEVVMTDPALPSGTDRVAAVARLRGDIDLFVNVQGDEPEMTGSAVDQVIELLERDPAAVMATLATPIRSRELLEDPACVKVVLDDRGRARYFSRSVIPHPRQWEDSLLRREPPLFLQHLGIYAYRREFLLQLTELPPCALEEVERLEQLRVLAAGYEILVGITPHAGRGIDTPADYAAFVARSRAA